MKKQLTYFLSFAIVLSVYGQTGTVAVGHSFNTGVGSGYKGNYNVNVGGYAGYAGASSAIHNISIGYEAGRYNSTGDNNAFVGFRSGRQNTSGYENGFFGAEAGYKNTSGYRNVAIGYRAGYNNQGGDRNVFIGYYAGYSETGNDKLYIDNSSTASPLIWGNFSSNQVKINGSLEVTGGFTGSGFNTTNWDTAFGWGNHASQGYIKVGNSPSFGTIAATGDINANNGLRVDGNTVIDNGAGWHRSYGATGWYNGTHGGGIYMADGTWIRTYGNKSFYHNTGTMRTDGTFQVGPSGDRFVVNSSGNVGIGATSPAKKLHVVGDTYLQGKVHIGSTDTYFYRQTTNRIATQDEFYVMGESPNTYLYSTHTYLGAGSGDNIHLRGNHFDWTSGGGGVINTAGNVGIGTTSPTSGFKLDVIGSIKATGGNSNNWNTAHSWGNHAVAGYLQDDNINDVNGLIGIGTTTPDEKLTVKGKIHTEEVIVDLLVPAPDYVFADNYQLTTLKEVEDFIRKEKHLPEIPSAKEMEENGLELGVMNMLLLKKIEELTLYQIQLLKRLDNQNERIEKLENN